MEPQRGTNPFLDSISPHQTGASNISGNSLASAPAPVSRPSYAPPSGPPPPLPTSTPTPSSLPTEEINEEPPPPYSLSANQTSGEAALEFGPRRPFQPPPPQPPAPTWITPQPTNNTWNNPRVQVQGTGGSSWQQYPGTSNINNTPQRESTVENVQPGGHNFNRPAMPPPPPRHPSTLAPRRTSSSVDRRPSSYGGTPSPSPLSNPPSSSSAYRPPPGPPPLAQGLNRSTSSASAPPPNVNDGKPTTVPTPGRPLLRDGKVLVYPAGYLCYKCDNIGYKNYDPTHPCRKCWEKYSKPYVGPLTYASWADPIASNFQRPLPDFRSSSHPNARNGPPPPQIGFTRAPPPGAVVVQPGDPRIGGRLCWNCGGDGLVSSFFLFDTETCPTCRGMGRVFP